MDYKSKLLAALKQKVQRNEPHRHICINCSNLLDIVLDFRTTAIKASLLLSAGKGSLESDSWDRPDIVNAIESCKSTVQTHSKQIDSVYAEHIKQEDSRIPEQDEAVEPQEIYIKLEATEMTENREEAVHMSVEPEVEPCAAVKQESVADGSSENLNNKDDNVPSSSENDVPFKRKKKGKRGTTSSTTCKLKENAEFRPQLCDFCGKRVCGEAAESHKNQHLGIQPYPCSEPGCNRMFYGRYHRLRHVRRMHSETGVKEHPCHVCGRNIRGPKEALRRHLERHERNQKNQKDFICPVCGKGFTHEQYLKQHSISHSEEFPHKCSYCGKRFNNKWSMRTHEKNMHEKRNHAALAQNLTHDESNSTANGANANVEKDAE